MAKKKKKSTSKAKAAQPQVKATVETTVETPATAVAAEVAAEESTPQAPAPTPPSLKEITQNTWFPWVMLGIIMIMGGYFRWVGLDWDNRLHVHPDERFLTMVTSAISSVDSFGEFLDPEISTLNPYNNNFNFFSYGFTPLFFVRYLAEWLEASAGGFLTGTYENQGFFFGFNTSYDGVHLVGRFLSGLFDMFNILLIFLIGRRMFDWKIGLLAAAFMAMAVAPIQQAHYFTVDNFASFFVTLVVYFAARALTSENWGNYVGLGIALGMGMASRINVAPWGLLAAFAAASYIWTRYKAEGKTRDLFLTGMKLALFVVLAAAVTIITFRIGQPYAFSGTSVFDFSFNETWLANIEEVSGQVDGSQDWPPAHHWAFTGLSHPVIQMMRVGMGWPLGIVAILGFLLAGWQMAMGRWEKHIILVPFTAVYFVWMGSQWFKFIRYFLPIYPIMCLLAAWVLFSFYRGWRDQDNVTLPGDAGAIQLWAQYWLAKLPRITISDALRKQLALGAMLIVTVGTFVWAFAFTRVYTRTHTHLEASNWIFENVPAPFNLQVETADGSYSHPVAIPYDFVYWDAQPFVQSFRAQATGTVTAIKTGLLGDPDNDSAPESFTVGLSSAADPNMIETLGTVSTDFAEHTSIRDGALTISLDKPFEIIEGQTYHVISMVPNGAPVSLAGASIAKETNWDLGLPARTQQYDPFSGMYRDLNLELHTDANQEKLDRMVNVLSEADYIVIGTNRQYDAYTKMPLRFPLLTEYFDALFANELGYAEVKVIENAPTFGPITFNDQSAEESFTVYDHPKVLIYEKLPSFDADAVRARLETVDLDKAVQVSARDYTAAPTALLLPAERQAEQGGTGIWNSIFNPSSLFNSNQGMAIASWWTLVIVIGWAAFPITFVALRGLPGKGYAVTKTVGILLLSWFVWIFASFDLIAFGGFSSWLFTAVIAAISVWVYLNNRADINAWLKENLAYIATVEAFYVALFGFGVWYRMQNPDLWHPFYGGEKPMDFAYFNAVLRSTSFPPYDPWFSGGYINYYYYSFVLVGTLTRMLGLLPSIAYNLAIPLVFAITGMGAFSGAYNLAAYANLRTMRAEKATEDAPRKRWNTAYLAGGLGILMMVVLGNLAQFDVVKMAYTNISQRETQVMVTDEVTGEQSFPERSTLSLGWQTLRESVSMQEDVPIRNSEWFWSATRNIPPAEGEAGVITEFPAFTFIYGDLHAHMVVMPLALLAMAWAISTALDDKRGRKWQNTVIYWALGGLATGVIYPTNTWDYPAYLALGVAALIYAEWRKHEEFSLALLIGIGWRAALLVVLSRALFQPYYEWYGLGYSEIEIWEGSRTSIGSYVKNHGLFLFILVTFLSFESFRLRDGVRNIDWENFPRLNINPISLISGLLFIQILLGAAAYSWYEYNAASAILSLPLAGWAAFLLIHPKQTPERRVILTLIGLGAVLTFVVEIVRLSGDIGRMNTVFKFYLQVWSVFVVASAASVTLLLPKLRNWHNTPRAFWWVGLGTLVFIAGLYPMTAPQAKLRERFDIEAPHTLDGWAYMETAVYNDNGNAIELAHDLEGIRWMTENVTGLATIVEAQTPEYRWGSRYSINTGMQAVLGWNWHQRQQRALMPERMVWNRATDVERLYNSTDFNEKLKILQKYDVDYVILGAYERAYYDQNGLNALSEMSVLRSVYSNPGVTIYEVTLADTAN